MAPKVALVEVGVAGGGECLQVVNGQVLLALVHHALQRLALGRGRHLAGRAAHVDRAGLFRGHIGGFGRQAGATHHRQQQQAREGQAAQPAQAGRLG